MDPLVSTASLADLLAEPSRAAGLVVLDATTTLPGERFDPDAAFLEARIPGAVRFEIDLFSDPDTTLPHMAPSQGRFARLIGQLGVCNDSDIVFYDQTGVASAARGWWLARLFGHDRVRVLDGGLPAWRAEGRPLQTGPAAMPAPRIFLPQLRTERLAGLGDLRILAERAAAGSPRPDHEPRLLDARSAGRFAATVPEPRAHLPGGHIPGAVSLPFGALLDGTRFLPVAALRARFAEAGVSSGDAVVASCGSGLTASVLLLGLEAAGLGPGALYDGSWTEWAEAILAGVPLPIATGPAR